MAQATVSNLTERELLILLNDKVDRLEMEVQANRATADKINQLEIRLMKQEVTFKIWGTVIGFVAGVGGSVISQIIKL